MQRVLGRTPLSHAKTEELSDGRRPLVVHPDKHRAPFLIAFRIREVQERGFVERQRLIRLRGANLVLSDGIQQSRQLGVSVDGRLVIRDAFRICQDDQQPCDRKRTATKRTATWDTRRQCRRMRHQRPLGSNSAGRLRFWPISNSTRIYQDTVSATIMTRKETWPPSKRGRLLNVAQASRFCGQAINYCLRPEASRCRPESNLLPCRRACLPPRRCGRPGARREATGTTLRPGR